MRRMLLLILIFFCCTETFYCQTFSLNELIDLASYNKGKSDTYLNHRGYKVIEQGSDYIKYIYAGNKNQSDSTSRCVTRSAGNSTISVTCDQLKIDEYTALKEKMQEEGFTMGEQKNQTATQIFQKNNITVLVIAQSDSAQNVYYHITVEKKNLPRQRDIVYAEDLLALTSHENIATVFGPHNVVKDVFIYPDGKIKNCSVLFPNSKDEVLFLWEDEANYRDIAILRFGGSAHTKRSLNYANPIEQNSWVSKQGIYNGMSLKELDKKNGDVINFYGWDWNTGGTLTADNKGAIDFKKISLVLSCLNCNDTKYYRSHVNKSTTALEEDRSIHVATIILLPDK